MVFKEKTGKKFTESKDFCKEIIIDISNLDKVFHVEKYLGDKKEKTITLGDKKVNLNNNQYLIFKLYNDYSKYLDHEFNTYLSRDVSYKDGSKQFNLPKYVDFVRKGIDVLVGSYVLYCDYDKDEVSEFVIKTYKYLEEAINRAGFIDEAAVRKIQNATDKLESDYQSAMNKAIGGEMGWLYGTTTYAGAAAGTYLTKATLETDEQKAQDRFNSSLSSIKFNRDNDYQNLLENTYKTILNNFMNFIFKDDFKDFELSDIYNYIINERKNDFSYEKGCEVFYKYPFIMSSYFSVIPTLDEKEYDSLFEVIDYFDIREDFNAKIRVKINDYYLNKFTDHVSKNNLLTVYYKFYCKLNDLDAEEHLDKYLYNFFSGVINNKNIYFYKANNLEFACEVMNRLNNVKEFISNDTYNNLVNLLKKVNKTDSIPKINGIDDFKPVIGFAAAFILLCVLIAKILIFGEDYSFGVICKQLLISGVFGVFICLANYYLDVFLIQIFGNSFTNNNVISWFSLKGAKKRKTVILISLCSIFAIGTLLLIPLTSVNLADRLDIFSANSWEEDGYSSDYRLHFDKNGTLTVLDIDKNKVNKYQCSINFDSSSYDKDKTWYDTHGGMSCDIDGEEVGFMIRTCIYKEYMEDTHLYLECSDSKSCPDWAKANWSDDLDYVRSNYSIR